ncbi:hypothetical protein DL96DRAFT_1620879 [Flagelloscypha sp. PMI_526]|nr:hypothetical protein DL96DRAFT_1620879 [Flagelloscypha sp. PMI_526]
MLIICLAMNRIYTASCIPVKQLWFVTPPSSRIKMDCTNDDMSGPGVKIALITVNICVGIQLFWDHESNIEVQMAVQTLPIITGSIFSIHTRRLSALDIGFGLRATHSPPYIFLILRAVFSTFWRTHKDGVQSWNSKNILNIALAVIFSGFWLTLSLVAWIHPETWNPDCARLYRHDGFSEPLTESDGSFGRWFSKNDLMFMTSVPIMNFGALPIQVSLLVGLLLAFASFRYCASEVGWTRPWIRFTIASITSVIYLLPGLFLVSCPRQNISESSDAVSQYSLSELHFQQTYPAQVASLCCFVVCCCCVGMNGMKLSINGNITGEYPVISYAVGVLNRPERQIAIIISSYTGWILRLLQDLPTSGFSYGQWIALWTIVPSLSSLGRLLWINRGKIKEYLTIRASTLRRSPHESFKSWWKEVKNGRSLLPVSAILPGACKPESVTCTP